MSALKAEAFDTTVLADSGPRGTPLSSRVDRWVGTTLDHFKVERALARGGMGAVFLATDQSLDRRVAIKVLPDELADEPHLQERFTREARAQARLNSPHVVHIYYVGRTPELDNGQTSLFFAMELVEGGSLEQVLGNGQRLEPERARRLMIEVARGLRDAQKAGIIHRDIKPGNLLLDKDDHVKIADFGVAKPVDETNPSITLRGAVVGSPLYMAPEQARGAGVDHRSDMYALACTFYHLLSGEPPFDGTNALAVVSGHLTRPPRPLREIAPDVPKPLAKIIERLMQKEPSERYANYDALIADLEAAAPESKQHAGFWARGAAVGVDVGLAGTLIGLIGWPALPLHIAYVTFAHARWGQTVGKHLLRLSVRRTDGSPLGLGRSVARTIMSLWLPFLVGLVILLTEGTSTLEQTINHMQPAQLDAFRSLVVAIAIGNALLSLLWVAGLALAAFHPQKRAAHDLVVGSEVIYRLEA